MQYFLGIDGGGTKSRLIIGDEQLKTISIEKGDSINIFSVGVEKTFKALKQLIDSSLQKQNIDISQVKRICVAAAGLARKYETEEFENFFKQTYPFLRVIFTTDIMALMVGALKEQDGICLISGTGSVAMGQDNNKNIIRAGGFGWRLGDEGSASNISLEAVRRIIRSYEKRDLETSMMKPLLDFFKLNKVEDTVQFFHNPHLDKASVAAAAFIVTEAARGGDPLALDILKKSAKELFKLVLSVHNRLPQAEKRVLITAGGVFEHDEIVNKYFEEELKKYNSSKENELNKIERIPLKTNALDGALYIAKNKL